MSFLCHRAIPALALLALAAAAIGQPLRTRERLLVYQVERIAPGEAPTIDGKLEEPVWRDKATISTLRNFLGPLTGEFASQRSEFSLVTDGSTLFLGATFHDDDMAAVRLNPGAEPFWNDCTELYLDPRHDGLQQIQLVVDCGGRKWWQKRVNRGYGWLDDSAWYVLARWEAAAARGEATWTIEVALDCGSFGISPEPGQVCGFNACRFRLGSKQQELSAWGFSGSGRQKTLEAWGHLLFGPAGQKMRGEPVSRADIGLIYSDLGERVVEFPLEDGFRLIARDSERTVRFAQLLRAAAADLASRSKQAQAALAGAPGAAAAYPALGRQVGDLVQGADALAGKAGAPSLTLGSYDRLCVEMGKLGERLDALTWKIKLAELVADVGAREGAKP